LADCVGRTAEEATGRWSDERRDMLASYTESLAACVEALGQLETAGEV
jgi:hypothetical protein